MITRIPTKIVKIKEIIDAEYIKPENESGYIIYNDEKISRVLVYGVIINKTETDVSDAITIDDGSGNIDVKSFEKIEEFESLDIGDIVFVIGRIREFGKKYILYEFIKKLDNIKWFEFFEQLRELTSKVRNQKQDSQSEKISEVATNTKNDSLERSERKVQNFEEISVFEKNENNRKEDTKLDETESKMEFSEINLENQLLDIIKELDNGSGAEYDEIAKRFKDSNLDDLLLRLLESGDIYEYKPRRYKVLE